MNAELNDRRELEMDLRDAIERNELELHYQPIIDLERNVITGFEALARWRHPVKGMVPPAVVHSGGGRQRPDRADRRMGAARRPAGRRRSGRTICKIAVNLSPVQFLAPNLPEIVQRALPKSGLAPHRLEIEITERIIMEDTERTLSNLAQAEGARRAHRHGRLRHRLLVAQLSAPLPVRQDQGRPHLRVRPRRGHRARRDRAGGASASPARSA